MTLNWLLVFLPIGIGLNWYGASPILVFLTSALAIVPLAGLMGDATEALAKFLGPTIGGLLNATLGNAPEIIISSFALHAGLVDIVKSSLTGSIIGNLLLGLGVAFFAGGIKHRRNQRFDTHATRTTTALLTLASFGLIIPAAFQFSASASRTISLEVAALLFLVYLASLVAIFVTRKPVIGKEGVKANLKEKEERPDEAEDQSETGWSRNKALGILAAVTIALAIMSEILTGAPRARLRGLAPDAPVCRGLLAGPGRKRRRALQCHSVCPQGPDGPVHRNHGGRQHPGGSGRRSRAGVSGSDHGPEHGPDLFPARADRDRDGNLSNAKPDVRRRVELAGRIDAHRRLRHVRNWVFPPPQDRSAQSANRSPGRRGAAVIDARSQLRPAAASFPL